MVAVGTVCRCRLVSLLEKVPTSSHVYHCSCRPHVAGNLYVSSSFGLTDDIRQWSVEWEPGESTGPWRLYHSLASMSKSRIAILTVRSFSYGGLDNKGTAKHKFKSLLRCWSAWKKAIWTIRPFSKFMNTPALEGCGTCQEREFGKSRMMFRSYLWTDIGCQSMKNYEIVKFTIQSMGVGEKQTP